MALMLGNRLLPGPTFAERIERHGGHTRGFDYLRFGLAFSVLFWHTVKATSGPDMEAAILRGPMHGLVSLILPMFFALSGFLVCGSLERTKALLPFIAHRVLRIIPALAVEITLSALILGPVATELPLKEYFSGRDFYSYFLNILGSIHYHLPGVFENNPEPGTVNTSLWTIPYELRCYIGLIVLAIIGWLKRVRLMVGLILLIGVAFTVNMYLTGKNIDAMQYTSPGRLLLVCFLAGNTVYLLRRSLRFTTLSVIGAAILCYAMLERPETMFFCPLPVAYLTACLGLLNPPKIPVLMDGDYSYGLYLFAFPIQQACSALLPGGHFWFVNVFVASTLSLGYAFISWHLIEQPVLRKRKQIVAMVERTWGTILQVVQSGARP